MFVYHGSHSKIHKDNADIYMRCLICMNNTIWFDFCDLVGARYFCFWGVCTVQSMSCWRSRQLINSAQIDILDNQCDRSQSCFCHFVTAFVISPFLCNTILDQTLQFCRRALGKITTSYSTSFLNDRKEKNRQKKIIGRWGLLKLYNRKLPCA